MKILKRATIVFVLFFAVALNLIKTNVNAANPYVYIKNVNASDVINTKNQIRLDFIEELANRDLSPVPGNSYIGVFELKNDTSEDITINSKLTQSIDMMFKTNYQGCIQQDSIKEYAQKWFLFDFNIPDPVSANPKPLEDFGILQYYNDYTEVSAETNKIYPNDVTIKKGETQEIVIYFELDFDADNCSQNMDLGIVLTLPYLKTISYSQAQADGEKDKITSSKIDLTLSNDIGDLTTDNLTISNDKVKVEKITNNGDGKYTLDISGEWDQDDKVDIKVSKDGYTINPDTQSTTLNKEKPHDNPDPGPGPNPNPTPDPDPTPDPKPNPKPTPTDNTAGVNKKKKQDKVDNVKKTNNDNNDHDLPRSGIEDLMVTYYFVIAGIVLATYSLYKRKYEV